MKASTIISLIFFISTTQIQAGSIAYKHSCPKPKSDGTMSIPWRAPKNAQTYDCVMEGEFKKETYTCKITLYSIIFNFIVREVGGYTDGQVYGGRTEWKWYNSKGKVVKSSAVAK